jgi:BlaR1 peptidase M56
MTTSEAIRATLSWLGTYGLHSTFFLGGAWLLCRLRAPRSNRSRERVWKLALVGGVLSASLQLALGQRPLLGRIDWAPLASAEVSRPEALSESRSAQSETPSEPAHLSATETSERAARTDDARRESRERSLERRGTSGVTRTVRSESPAGSPRTEAPRMEARAPETDAAPQSLTVAVERDPDLAPRLAAVPEGEADASRGAARLPAHDTALLDTEELDTEQEPGEPSLAARLGSAAGSAARVLSPRWPGLVLLGWVAVGLTGVLGLAASWTCLRRRMLGREVLRSGPLVERLDELRARAGLRRRVRLSVSTRIRAPFSTGVLWPEVCVPSAVLTDLTRAQQEALLAHELAHLVRRDPAWFGLSFLIETLFFFQPLNRVARRELSDLAEVACDDWAVRWTGARLALASCLTEVAGWIVGEPHRRLALPGLAGERSRLGQRVTRLLDDRRSPAGEPPMPWWPPLAGGALALVAFAVPGVSATREARPETAPVPLPEPASTAGLAAPGTPAAASPAPAPLATASAPAASPLAEPAAAASEPPVPNASLTLEVERGVLESELALLESELGALRAELAVRALDARFAEALTRIDARMDELRAQHVAVRQLLERLGARLPSMTSTNTTNTPTLAPAPDAPLSNEAPGDPR